MAGLALSAAEGRLLLAGTTFSVAVADVLFSPSADALFTLVASVLAIALGLWLKSFPRPVARWAPVLVGGALLAGTVTTPPSFGSLAIGLGAGLVTLLWVGLGDSAAAPLAAPPLARELLLPVVGGAVTLVVAGIPLLQLLRPAALVIPVFAGLALLIVLLAELALQPREERPDATAGRA